MKTTLCSILLIFVIKCSFAQFDSITLSSSLHREDSKKFDPTA